MFITLKAGSKDDSEGMEQIASRGARPGQEPSRLRLGRRAACLACHSRKLRCTGRIGDCDRCRSRSLVCVFPNHPSVSGTQRATTASSEAIETAVGTAAHPADPLDTEPTSAVVGPNPIPQDATPAEITGNIDGTNAQSLMQLAEDYQTKSQLWPFDSNPTDNNSYYPENLSYVFNNPQDYSLPAFAGPQNSVPFPLDSFLASSNTASDPTIHDQTIDHFTNIPNAPDLGIMTYPLSSSTPAWPPLPDTCSCMSTAVRVVQQLGDDDFRITTISLGEILQLQKQIIVQCNTTLDCPLCGPLLTIQTLLLMICDRLTEKFECLHKRIKMSNQRIVDTSSHFDFPSQPSTERPGELHCTTSHGPAANAPCNTELFSIDFQIMYDNEEQVHMIRVLLKLRIRNFRALLLRLGDCSQISGSEARQARVKALLVRLAQAACDIDGSLKAAFQLFASPPQKT